LHRLHLAGVGVVFTADGIPEGDEGELIQGVKSWQARQYSVKLARDSIRGQISNIRERKSAPGGMAPYGYDKQHLTGDGQLLRTLRWMPDCSKQEFGPDGRLLRVVPAGVNLKKAKSDIIRYVPSLPERVAVVKRMFDLCVQGYGFHHIAQTFNAEGIPSPGGQKWNTARIAKLIRNPVYRGAVVWNRHTMGSLFGLDGQGVLKPKRKKMWQRNTEADWIISEDVHEALVSKDTWNAAQQAVAKRRAEHGNARPTKRTLLAGLLVCKRCGNPFTTIRDRRWPGPTGEGYRVYACSGYHRYGKTVCRVVNVPGPALDRFVLDAVRKVLLGDHATVEKAVDAFVTAVLAPRAKAKPTRGDERELDLLNRKIKATVSMLADPTFDGLDELRTTLADLKAKRDVLEARLKPADEPATPAITESDLRAWATEQFTRLDDLATRTDIDLADRQMLAAFVEKIEVNPDDKTGTVFLHAGLERAFADGSTRLPGGDFMGAFEIAFYGWKEGARHLFLGPNNVTDLWHVKKVNPQSMIHLTEKPVELAVRAMQYSSREGEHVLDLFGCSGSTLIAAEQTGRKAYLMELDPLYCDVICERWCKFTGKEAFRVDPQGNQTPRSELLAGRA